MFTMKAKAEKTGLEEARDTLLIELKNFQADADEYTKMMVHLKTLSELIKAESHERLNPNTVALVSGNVVIALMVIGFEKTNVVTTKVVPFLLKAVK
jgi:hypothetical protein